MLPDRLIHMANQIATFFLSQPAADAEPGFADHINKYWDPRMRRQLLDHGDAGGEGLNPLVMTALPFINRPAEQSRAS